VYEPLASGATWFSSRVASSTARWSSAAFAEHETFRRLRLAFDEKSQRPGIAVEERHARHAGRFHTGHPLGTTRARNQVNGNVVSPGFFKTLGIPLVMGRDFGRQDTAESRLVTIISETATRQYFGTVNPLGRRVSFRGTEGPWYEIVGVARNSKYATIGEDAIAVAYLPLAQNHEMGMVLYARTSIPPVLRREVQALEPKSAAAGDPDDERHRLDGAVSGARRRLADCGVRRPGATPRGGGGVRSALLLHVADAPTFVISALVLVAVALAACLVPASRAMRIDPISVLRYE
jgi:hypothetical protein